MSAEGTFRKVTAAVSGVLFLVLGGLLLVGFGGLAQYSFWVRALVAFAVVVYGVMRIRGAFRKGVAGA